MRGSVAVWMWGTRCARAQIRWVPLPTPDRGYVVGDHGMIYRYRVVPIEYTAKGMVEAPMMPVASAISQ